MVLPLCMSASSHVSARGQLGLRQGAWVSADSSKSLQQKCQRLVRTRCGAWQQLTEIDGRGVSWNLGTRKESLEQDPSSSLNVPSNIISVPGAGQEH